MIAKKPIEQIIDQKTLISHLNELVLLDERLKPILEISGEVPLRLREGGFAGMVNIISSQLLSVASAKAIHQRLVDLMGEVSAARYFELSEEQVRQCGFSRAKYNTMLNVAQAERDGQLEYNLLAKMPANEAIKNLTSIKGIGVWSAEIYLLFCDGHADIFPAGDLVLQKMLAKVLDLPEKPNEKITRELTKNWSPFRGAAARLLWRYFAVLKNREGI